MRNGRSALLFFVVLIFAATAAAQTIDDAERSGGPYVPTPQIVVDEMLAFANVGPQDFVVDLGSGDGVIVLTAAERYKAHGFGVDIDPQLVNFSNSEAQRLGVADRASFYVQDVFKADLSRASVVTLYLLPEMMVNLRAKIYFELRPGARVVAHDYSFDDWQPDDEITFDVPEKEKVNGVPSATLYLWIVPAKVAGHWKVRIEDGEQYDMTLRQNFQMIDGTVRASKRKIALTQASLRGTDITFAFPDGGARLLFTGRAAGNIMKGTVEMKGRTVRWTADRDTTGTL